MNMLKLNLMFWVAGLTAGIVLMERWRRHGGRYVPVESLDEEGDTSPVSTAPSTPAAKPSTSALILAGVKADAERARRSVNQLRSLVGPSHGPA